MSNIISEQIKSWVAVQIGTQEFSVIQLAGDASARRYYRVIFEERTWVLMSWEPFDKNNYPFISVQKHFAGQGVQVPEILAVGEQLGVLLQEDLGDLTLERKFWENAKQESSRDFYEKTLNELIKIHNDCTLSGVTSTATTTVFDTAKFLWEMNYAKDNLLLGLLKLNLSDTVLSELNTAFTGFCSRLDSKPKVICHRDFHSRNVMIKLNKIYVIDFQDARMGPVQYDLVSLFKDSYVDMSDEYSKSLMNYYLDKSGLKNSAQFSNDEFYETYELQSLQRCFKACGSFASFMNLRHDKRYLKYLNPTLKRVFKSLVHFPEYNILHKILIDAGALGKKLRVYVVNLFFLAAGLGSRLKPVTEKYPKPCVPFLNVPLGLYQFRFLNPPASAKCVANTFYLPDQVHQLFSGQTYFPHKFQFSDEAGQILGSAGGLKKASSLFDLNAPILMMNADEIYFPEDTDFIEKALQRHLAQQNLATLITMNHPEAGKKFGAIWCDGDKVQDIGKASTNSHLLPRHYIGMILLHPSVLKLIPDNIETNIFYDVLIKELAHGKVESYNISTEWYETGNPEDFFVATKTALKNLTPATMDFINRYDPSRLIKNEGGLSLVSNSVKVDETRLYGYNVISKSTNPKTLQSLGRIENAVLFESEVLNEAYFTASIR